jgi:type IX secretion system PorP/SprF family membrane protein
MLLLTDRRFIFCIIILFVSNLDAQQYIQFSNYTLNSIMVNPAYAGSKPGVELMATYRGQWRKIEGSPTTYSASGHSLIKNSKIGVGGIIVKDEIGLSDNLFLSTCASYSISLNKFTLNFGLNGGVQANKTDFNQITTIEDDDVAFSGSSSYQYSPVIGAGIYLFNKDFYLGVSSPDLLETGDNSENSLYQKKRHYYFSMGKVFGITPNLKVKPTLLVKVTSAIQPQFDFSGTVIFHDLVGLGASYRTQAGMVLFAQFFINEKWIIAYAYDNMTNNLSSIEGGTHEVTLILNLLKRQNTIYSPRYF